MRKLLLLILLIAPILLSAQTGPKTANDSVSKDSLVYTVVEETAQYPDGEAEMYRFISKNMQYPQKAVENNIQGTVYISFIVEPDGTITDVKIVKDIGFGCGAEAARVVKIMPRWKPAKQMGTPVRVMFTLPFKFKLAD